MESLKSQLASLSAEAIQALLLDREDLRVLTRLTTPTLSPLPPEEPGHLVLLDTEGTGKDALKDEMVELGMVKVLYCKRTLRLCSIVGRFNQLRDPGIPMPPEATAVNHITDEMLVGQSIDFAEAAAFIEDADLIVAHNAIYDRQLVERYIPEFFSKAWACSFKGIDWASVGINGGKLDYIAFRLGFFYEGHRATVDCEALLQVLASMVEGEDGPTTPFEMLATRARTDSFRVYAFGAPFDMKDVLKKRNYNWHAGETAPEKSWYLDVLDLEALQAEFQWLKEAVYNRRSFSPGVVKFNAFSRFSSRMPTVKREYL